MFIRKIKKILYKKITRKNKLIFLGDFNMALGNKDRSTDSKGFCESQKKLMSLIAEFDVEALWRRHNRNDRLHTYFHGRSNPFSCIDRAYKRTNLRVGVKIDH